MLSLLATDEFAEWFRALPDCDAEDVATAVELLENLGDTSMVPHSRELLLWYQGRPPETSVFGSRLNPAAIWNEPYLRLMARVRQATEHLESDAVQSALSQLSNDNTAAVRAAIIKIKAQISPRRVSAVARDEAAARDALNEVERYYRTALECVGLPDMNGPDHSNSLRELNLCERAPGIRILYGLDLLGKRALLVLGEHLDRRAYGSSVRRAESVWQQFLTNGSSEGLESMTGTGKQP